MRLRRPSTAAAVLLTLTSVAGCSGDDDAATPSALGDGLGTIAGGLAALPESGEETETVLWGDMARAADIAGVEPPDDPGDTDAVVDYVQILTNGRVDASTASPVLVLPPETAGADRIAELDAFADELGWSILDVDRFVERQTAPDVVTVLEGGFDEGAITEALDEPSDGLWVAGDPDHEDFELDPGNSTAARPLGETLWLGLDGDRLAVTRARTSAEATQGAGTDGIDGGVGDSEAATTTLADDETFSALAEALDAESPYAAMLVRPGVTVDPVDVVADPERADDLCEAALPEATTGVATGIGDDDGPVYLVALAHDSAAAAADNAEALEEMVADGSSTVSDRPWSEVVTLDGVEVTGDDQVVVARLRPVDSGPPNLWYQLLTRRDSLIGHC